MQVPNGSGPPSRSNLDVDIICTCEKTRVHDTCIRPVYRANCPDRRTTSHVHKLRLLEALDVRLAVDLEISFRVKPQKNICACEICTKLNSYVDKTHYAIRHVPPAYFV